MIMKISKLGGGSLFLCVLFDIILFADRTSFRVGRLSVSCASALEDGIKNG